MRTLIYSFIAVFIVSCGANKHEPFSAGIEVTIDSSATCPFLTTDHQKNVVLSYVSHLNDSVSEMRFVVSQDGGVTFGTPVSVNGSRGLIAHSENMPKLVFKPSGEVIAAWVTSNPRPKNKYAGMICYAQSFDGGRSWTKSRALVTDTGSSDQRYFDLAVNYAGEAMMVWLDSRGGGEHSSGIFVATTNQRNGFSEERLIGNDICPCCRTDLFVDHRGGIHAAFRGILGDTVRDMVRIGSVDNGENFSSMQRISADNWAINGCPHTGPSMTEAAGRMHYAWYTGSEPAGVFYCRGSLDGLSFDDKYPVSEDASAKHPQITIAGNMVAIVWDETVKHGDHFNSRIGLQLRESAGDRVVHTSYLTIPASVNDFPVIVVSGNALVVAYSGRSNGSKGVKVKRLTGELFER